MAFLLSPFGRALVAVALVAALWVGSLAGAYRHGRDVQKAKDDRATLLAAIAAQKVAIATHERDAANAAAALNEYAQRARADANEIAMARDELAELEATRNALPDAPPVPACAAAPPAAPGPRVGAFPPLAATTLPDGPPAPVVATPARCPVDANTARLLNALGGRGAGGGQARAATPAR